jgi:NADPH:quinone reductase-like Zn-dependent oxidoreductase
MNHLIRAIVVDPAAPARLAIREVDPPLPLPHEAIVRVAAISLNRGEIRRSGSAAAGWRPGWDFAGTVEGAAADGSGVPVGSRVVGFLPAGAWAEQIAVPTDVIVPLPEAVDFTTAATLPIAGLTALLALELGGSLLMRSVLVTGASGGVGYFACQLAAQMGARVTAQVRRPELVEFVKTAKAHQVVVGNALDRYGPYDLALDSVGGEVLPLVLANLGLEGTCVLLGTTAGSQISFNGTGFYGKGGLRLYGFILFHELKKHPAQAGLTRLVKLVAEGLLMPHIALEESWSNIASVAQQLTERQFLGKAVLHLSP